MKKQMMWKTKGMNQDLSVSAFNPEFTFENMNLRLSTNDSNTMMSWVNEKGTSSIDLYNQKYWTKGNKTTYVEPSNLDGWTLHEAGTTSLNIIGTPIGTSVLNHKIILFTIGINEDYIYIFEYNTDKTALLGRLFYQGDLQLDTDHPLEILVSYESETIQKVYWVDGKNQPRIMNISGNYEGKPAYIFDFIPKLQLTEDVKITKKLGGNGMFAPGVIQYAFTYYNKYCQETNIFYTSPLLYISHADRGGNPEEKVDNAFEIKVSNLDTHFEYLRIYSIQRTSIDATPFVKRVQDIEIKGFLSGDTVSYTDTGTHGDTVDPTELLYKGGNPIIAHTLEQKDETLFFGNIETLVNKALGPRAGENTIKVKSEKDDYRVFTPHQVSNENYIYANQLTSYNGNKSVPCAGFKHGDKYRCGVQFQHNTGVWSNPTYIDDVEVKGKPGFEDEDSTSIKVPVLKGTIPAAICSKLLEKGFVKARAVVVYPGVQDRLTICQGVACPTLHTKTKREIDKSLYAQSSWFFRASKDDNKLINWGTGTVSPVSPEPSSSSSSENPYLEYTNNSITNNSITGYNPNNFQKKKYIRQVEIQGQYDDENKFQVERDAVTLHSPEIEFDDQMVSMDFSSFTCSQVGRATFMKTFSDINIQTETPTASNNGAGFTHKSFIDNASLGIVSGLFYDDYIVNDTNGDPEVGIYMGAYDGEYNPCKWMVYLWNKTGSLNNDINRPADEGTPTAKLKKKIISNLRFAESDYDYDDYDNSNIKVNTPGLKLFSSDEPTILKLENIDVTKNSNVYMGNIDTVLTPDDTDGMYFVFNDTNISAINVKNAFINAQEHWWKTYYDQKEKEGKVSKEGALYFYLNNAWTKSRGDFFSKYGDCAYKKDLVRMKYKSTPHLVFTGGGSLKWTDSKNKNFLPIVEVKRSSEEGIYGGDNIDILKEHRWIPCGEPVTLNSSGTPFEYSYGDTYYQRYDCLKTYAYTPEDENQVVEIGSFMLETRINIDGRYDRNRGQLNNLNMSPQNFNLINPVYSQLNNFFSYKIQDDSFYQDTKYPNQITWSKGKNSGAEIDLWTNVTLASVLDLDGNRGKISKLIRFNNYLFAFQDTGISQILYNDNVQISSTDGVPIEIANSGKVQGKDYKSNTVGCSNKWSMVTTPNGIYFMDSNEKSIYLFNGQLQNLTTALGFNSWAKNNIPDSKTLWEPVEFGKVETSDGMEYAEQSNFVAYYDKMNQDVLWINRETALAYSERFGAFTSFYDYGNIPFFCSLDDVGIWVTSNSISGSQTSLWKHQGGDYCNFFGDKKPYWTTLVGNPEPLLDKIFTNLEFRACVDGEGSTGGNSGIDTFDETYDETFHPEDEPVVKDKYVPFLPFDSLETWNEYQHGIAHLSNRNGHDLFKHHTSDNNATLKRKFRIWRCDIPRDNYAGGTGTFDDSFDYTFQGTPRKTHPVDRMRNPWLYLKLMKKAAEDGKNLPRAEIHDMVVTYYI